MACTVTRVSIISRFVSVGDNILFTHNMYLFGKEIINNFAGVVRITV